MAARTSPTDRQRRLGAEVRRMRTSAGVSAESAAKLLGVDRSKISNIEAGTRSISPDRLRALAQACACTDGRYIDALIDMARPVDGGNSTEAHCPTSSATSPSWNLMQYG